jgi:hypothetical protein
MNSLLAGKGEGGVYGPVSAAARVLKDGDLSSVHGNDIRLAVLFKPRLLAIISRHV